MMNMKAQMLLKDPEQFPSDKVLKHVLGDSVYNVLEALLTVIIDKEYGLTVEWRYYNDGKTWLGKVVYKKKTVFWLSVWESYFKAGFYFTAKHFEAIAALDISETIKDEFSKAKPSGKLFPMIFDINTHDQLQDLLTVIYLKKSLK